jgi:hypothetical protein
LRIVEPFWLGSGVMLGLAFGDFVVDDILVILMGMFWFRGVEVGIHDG